jgi:hypothetical protein
MQLLHGHASVRSALAAVALRHLTLELDVELAKEPLSAKHLAQLTGLPQADLALFDKRKAPRSPNIAQFKDSVEATLRVACYSLDTCAVLLGLMDDEPVVYVSQTFGAAAGLMM